MASFTDIIPKFNPYVQQLPVEAMVQVGMEKQKRYDEGIQKIQAQIDNIAGMDIAQDAQRIYLQSKLNELGNNLKGVAAGDFSNFQLVNSVGGMTNQLVKDPRIVNALVSTKNYRKGLEDMATLTKEGKASSSRTWEFKTAASEWLNGDVDASFNSQYKPYTNYRKNAMEVIKGLTKSKNITEDAFDIDENGNLEIKDAKVRTELAGISPEQIQQALLVGLSPDDFEQMALDGRYNYSNTTPQSFAESLTSSYKTNFNSILQQKTVLENALYSTSSAVEKDKINTKIKELDKTLDNIQKEYDGISKTFEQGDVESAKARLHTVNFMNGFSKAFSFTETSKTYETNPYVQPAQWRENKEMEWNKFMMEYDQKERIHLDTKRQKDEELRLKRLELEGYGPFPSGVDESDAPEVALDKVVKQTTTLKESLDNEDIAFMKFHGKDVGWFYQQKAAWMKSPSGVDPAVAQHFNKTDDLRNQVTENQVMIGKISAEADRRYGDVYKKIPKDAPNIIYTKVDGTRYTYTPKDFVDFNAKKDNYIEIETSRVYSYGSDVGGKVTYKYNDEKAKAELSPKDYQLYLINKQTNTRGAPALAGADRTLYQNLDNYSKLVNEPYQQVLKEKQKWIGGEVMRRVMGFQGNEYTIPTTTKTQQESLANFYTSIVNLAQSQKGKIANSPDLNLEILKKIAQSGNVQGVIKVVEGSEYAPAMYEVTATGAAGTTKFRITPEQKRSVFQDRFELSPGEAAFRPYLRMMMKYSVLDEKTKQTSPYMSTNPEGVGYTNVKNAALGPTHFPNVKSYGLSGNINTSDRGASISLRMNIYDPVSGKVHEDIPYPRLLLPGEVVGVMRGLTDESIHELITRKKEATQTDLKNLQEASKKPL